MELFILVISLAILAETSLLTIKSRKKPLINTNQKRKLYVDTSVLMDQRFLSVAQTGFIGDDVIIPRSVTNELQLLADGKDAEKRLRARAGLDVVRELERVVYFNTTILNDELDHTPVDNRLMELAKANHGLILTNDFNLQKVAATEHIDTLNLNELALALRNQFLPGENARIKVVSAGSNPRQGVGYLRDGTMVVVDNANDKIGQEIEVEFVKLNQTTSGTMLFARLKNSKSAPITSVSRASTLPKAHPIADSAKKTSKKSARNYRKTSGRSPKNR